MTRNFFWYDVMTTDTAAATKFYVDVVGWVPQQTGTPGYTALTLDGVGVAGLMAVPEDAAAMGARPAWMGYIHVADVPAMMEAIRAAGGKIWKGPVTIEGVITFAVVSDPQGAGFLIATPLIKDAPPRPAPKSPGTIGWHELYATDWNAVWPFYEKLFGWTKTTAVNMGPMGTYQLFSAGDGDIGGMMNRPAQAPMAYWNYYIVVPSVEAADRKIAAGGGQIVVPPMQVPGGGWVLQALDPQGAVFALTSAQK